MSLRLATPMLQDFVYLSQRMRPDEIEQWLAFSGLPEYDADTCARALAGITGPSFTLIDAAGYPVVAGGFEPVRPGVYEGWQVGTLEGWERHWRAITLHTNRTMRALLQGPAHRIELCALASRTAALEWYERGLKMTREGVLKGYAADGQDAVMFARSK